MTSRAYKYWYIKKVWMRSDMVVQSYKDNIHILWKGLNLNKRYDKARFMVIVGENVKKGIAADIDFFNTVMQW